MSWGFVGVRRKRGDREIRNYRIVQERDVHSLDEGGGKGVRNKLKDLRYILEFWARKEIEVVIQSSKYKWKIQLIMYNIETGFGHDEFEDLRNIYLMCSSGIWFR